jgi:glycosyltransferase involved in cell wall biosynthesis
MILGIDAANIVVGGGLHHLVELLKVADPDKHSFTRIIVFGSKITLDKIESRSWLTKISSPALNGNFIRRILWQRFMLSEVAKKYQCNLLFVPGGSYEGSFKPVVTMNQNLLPFEWRETCRYGFSLAFVRLLLLRFIQSRTFTSVDGIIFLTNHAKSIVSQLVQNINIKSVVIGHGINPKFSFSPKLQLPISNYSFDQPYRILYVSTIDMFKHQWNVVEAIAKLRSMGYPIVVELVGNAYPPALDLLHKSLIKNDPDNVFVNYIGYLPYDEIEKKYSTADLFIFASSCETFAQIITEAMCAGLPIACTEKSAMSELLQDSGVYFNPESPDSIASTIRRLLDDSDLRSSLANGAKLASENITWDRCANQTFSFLNSVLNRFK